MSNTAIQNSKYQAKQRSKNHYKRHRKYNNKAKSYDSSNTSNSLKNPNNSNSSKNTNLKSKKSRRNRYRKRKIQEKSDTRFKTNETAFENFKIFLEGKPAAGVLIDKMKPTNGKLKMTFTKNEYILWKKYVSEFNSVTDQA